MYASFLGISDALHLDIFQEPAQQLFFSNLLVPGIVNSWIRTRKPSNENRIPLPKGTRCTAQPPSPFRQAQGYGGPSGTRKGNIKPFIYLEPYALIYLW